MDIKNKSIRKKEDNATEHALKSSSSKSLKFVVQKHDATNLHFDFRLEYGGVLKSWAVPKGPSMNPSDKRLAVMVDDHPLDYADFEGTIPEGRYGAGTVEIWDSGTWKPLHGFEDVDKSLEEGMLEFTLRGEKLNGKFVMVELKNSYTRNGWLLIKKEDQEAVRKKFDAKEIPSHKAAKEPAHV